MTDKKRMTKYAKSLIGQVQPVYTMVAGEVVKLVEVESKIKPVSETDRQLLQDLEPDELFLSKRA